MKYFMLIWAGLWRKKTRTILTMLSIVVAFLLFGLLQGINQGIKAGLGDTGNHRLWTTPRMSAVSSMPTSLMDQIQNVKGVRNIAHLSFFGGYFQDAKKPPARLCHQHRQAGGRLSRIGYHRGADCGHESQAPGSADRTATGQEIWLEGGRQDSGGHDDLDQQGRQQQLGL
jgi:hypothetical protein